MPSELEDKMLIGLGRDLQELNRAVSAIDAKIEERDKIAKEWRGQLCKKIDDLKIDIENMRKFCLVRQLDKGKLWLAIFCTFAIPIILYVVAWAKVEQQVSINTNRITNIEDQYRVWVK